MNLPIEIVQQRGEGPLRLVLAQLPGVGRHARLHGQRVFAESLGLGELAENVPGLFAIEHGVHDSAGAGRGRPLESRPVGVKRLLPPLQGWHVSEAIPQGLRPGLVFKN